MNKVKVKCVKVNKGKKRRAQDERCRCVVCRVPRVRRRTRPTLHGSTLSANAHHAPHRHVARAEGRTPCEHCRGRWTASPPSSAAPLSHSKRSPSPLGTAARSADTPPRVIRETNRDACLSPQTHRERSPQSSPHVHNPRLSFFSSFLFFFPPLSSFIRSLLHFHFVRSLGTLC